MPLQAGRPRSHAPSPDNSASLPHCLYRPAAISDRLPRARWFTTFIARRPAIPMAGQTLRARRDNLATVRSRGYRVGPRCTTGSSSVCSRERQSLGRRRHVQNRAVLPRQTRSRRPDMEPAEADAAATRTRPVRSASARARRRARPLTFKTLRAAQQEPP